MKDKYFPHCLKKGTSGQRILDLKMEDILEDEKQEDKRGSMEDILLEEFHNWIST